MKSNKLICNKCGATNSLVKNGTNKLGTQRYKCKNCFKTFILNDTTTQHLRLSDYHIKKLIGYMIDDVTLDVIARNMNLNIKTIHYYRYIVFHALKNYQSEIKLHGTILIDETFMSIREKQYKIFRSDGKDIRGLSFNQLCIITLINLAGISTAKVSSRAMALPHHYIDLFTENIGKPDRFIHDGNPKQVQFMNQFECEKINGRKDDSGEFSTDLIDSYHSNLKRYFFKHAGYRLKNLQHYLNFFVYRQNYLSMKYIKNMKQKIAAKNEMCNDLLIRVKSSTKVVSYKTYLKDKGITDILENR